MHQSVQEHEPQIWGAIRFGSVLENVVRSFGSHCRLQRWIPTENTRCAYPLDYIPGRVTPSLAGHPKAVVFLTADAFDVLPPISILEEEQIMYHFIYSYTANWQALRRGISSLRAAFSACFGEPFPAPGPWPMPRCSKIESTIQDQGVLWHWLVRRTLRRRRKISLKYTRQMVTMGSPELWTM